METEALSLQSPVFTDLRTGHLQDDTRVARTTRSIGQLEGIFQDESARSQMDQNRVVYSVDYWRPVEAGTEGGLFWGNSTILPGTVGQEFFMTRGHFHSVRDRAEFYITVAGSGMLVLMDADRHAEVQEMKAGSTHYVPGRIAHRVVNVGDSPLTMLACWPSDAGHDYAMPDGIRFSLRILRVDGRPKAIAQP